MSHAAFNGNRRVPPPTNEPVRSYAPGSPERAALKTRLSAMAGETIDIPLVIGGQDIRTGDTGAAVMPHDYRHELGGLSQGAARTRAAGRRSGARRSPRVVSLVVRRSCGGAAAGRRAPDNDVARHRQRGDDARPVEDRLSGRDRLRLRDHRFLALQRAFRPGAARRAADQRPHHVEPARVPGARGVRLRGHSVQLHVDRRQPADRAGAHGQHRRLEAGVERDVLGALPDAASGGSRPAPRRHQLRRRRREDDLERRPVAPRARRRALHGQHGGVQQHVEDDRRVDGHATVRTRASSAKPAARISSWRIRPPIRRRLPSPSCAAATSSRDRSARRSAACTSRGRCGTRFATASSR